MINETTFLDTENLPPEIVGRFDEPWYFIGEVKRDVPWLQAPCSRCGRNRRVARYDPSQDIRLDTFQIVQLKAYTIITDDYIEVIIYWGTCAKCGQVAWARQGPPFSRVRGFYAVPA